MRVKRPANGICIRKRAARSVLRVGREVIVSLLAGVSNPGTPGEPKRSAYLVGRRDDAEISIVTNVRPGPGLHGSHA